MAPQRPRKARPALQARAVLAWGVGWFVLVQALAIGLLEWKRPELYDPKYGCRLLGLRARLADEPGKTLLLILGTSRAEQGFRPGLLPAWPGGTGPVVFNLARGGSSPLLNLLTLRRLLADGIHPDRLLLEIFPPSLVQEQAGATIFKMSLRDLPVLRRYAVNRKSWAYFLRDRLGLWYRYRSSLLACQAPAWLSSPARWGERWWDLRGGEWLEISEDVTAPERLRETADARRRYFHKLQQFAIAADADRALHALLDLCREQGIGVVLFLMPEASEFRSWYPPPARARLAAYLAALQREYGTPVIDARHWIPDRDFWDSHHLLRPGAAAFTQRFGAEVIRPLLPGLSDPAAVPGRPVLPGKSQQVSRRLASLVNSK